MRKAILFVLFAALSPGAMAQPAQDIYAKPQQRIALPGGRAINLVCVGQGSPVVILTAGAGDWSEHWQFVQGPIAQRTRVCAWDRAGYGYSDASNVPQSASATENDLEKALSGAGIGPPYLMVAHSAGSYETLLFADRHQKEIAGLILVDPSLPAMEQRIEAISPLAAKVVRQDIANRVRAFRACASNPVQVTAADAAICFHFSDSAKPFAAGLESLDHQPQRNARLLAQLDQSVEDLLPVPVAGEIVVGDEELVDALGGPLDDRARPACSVVDQRYKPGRPGHQPPNHDRAAGHRHRGDTARFGNV